MTEQPPINQTTSIEPPTSSESFIILLTHFIFQTISSQYFLLQKIIGIQNNMTNLNSNF